MKDLDIPLDLKNSLEDNQNRLKIAIREHQNIYGFLQQDLDNVDLQKDLNKLEEKIILIGREQKGLLEKLRNSYKVHQKNSKNNVIKNGIEERRINLSNALVRARKQNITTKSLPPPSFSEESNDGSGSNQSSPEHQPNPTEPQDLSQLDFLAYFSLATHENYREMQNRRVERKRRSTANPHFLYGGKGWDIYPKRKRGYLVQPISPPNTRQAVKRRNERISPPTVNTNSDNGTARSKTPTNCIPPIPNLPSELTIEKVSPCSSPESKVCKICKTSGNLVFCELCLNGFHVTCHDRPLSQTPKRCPVCYTKDSLQNSAELSAKIEEKQKLEEQNQILCAELNELQDHHNQLNVSLKDQKYKQDELRLNQQKTEEKIKQIITFIENIKNLPSFNKSS